MDRRFEGWLSRYGARGSAVLLGCVCLAMAPSVVASLTTSVPSFARARYYATGRSPDSIAIGDLNADARPDLITASYAANIVSVRLNKGNGQFEPKRDYRTGRRPVSVAIGDLNGDGKPELATANWGARSVSVLANAGDGSFQAKRDYATGGRPNSIAIGDLNGDGSLDLAVPRDINRVSVLLNRGDGSFHARRNARAGRSPWGIAIGDLNGDGTPDLATSNIGYDTVSVLLNRGDGSVLARRDYPTGVYPASLAIQDLSGDGRLDIVTANDDGDSVSVLLNRGGGTFRENRDYATGLSPASVATGDLNDDGRPDLIAANVDDWSANTVSVLLNRGGGSFHGRLDYGTGHGPALRSEQVAAIGDLNGDGRLDVAVAKLRPSTVSVLLANTARVCVVPKVTGRTLAAAKRALAQAECRVGKIRRAFSKVEKRRVISQLPSPRRVLPSGGRVTLLVSRGPE